MRQRGATVPRLPEPPSIVPVCQNVAVGEERLIGTNIRIDAHQGRFVGGFLA